MDVPGFSPQETAALAHVISAPRFATYLRATGSDEQRALALYHWNVQISAAFMVPLHFCEVAVRNAVAESLESVHGPRWPWSPGFHRSLPDPPHRYSPHKELVAVAANQPTTGKVVAELRFFFWQKMFTVRHDGRIWDRHLSRAFPALPDRLTTAHMRQTIHDEMDKIRDLRNRVAHHEPIFLRSLADEYGRIRQVIHWRCPVAAAWVDRVQTITGLIATKPR
jgi:hypothetical protein